MMTNCGCREISHDPIEFKIQDCRPQVHINCGPLLPNTNELDWGKLQTKVICDFKDVIKQLECGIQPDIEIILEEISLLFMNNCGYNVAKKMYSTDLEEDYFLRHNNFLSEFESQEEKDQVLLNLGIYDKIKNMVTEDRLVNGLNTKIGFVAEVGKYYYGFASEVSYSIWTRTMEDQLIIGKWLRPDYVPIKYTIIFNNMGGDPVNIGEIENGRLDITEGMFFNFPEPTWNSDSTRNFVGWYLNQEYTGEYYNSGERFIPKSGMTFYAKWVREPRILTFYSNYGNNESTVIDTYLGETVNLCQALVRTGYSFSGWNTQQDGSGTNYGANDSYIVGENQSFYAQWNINRYTVTFNYNYSSDPNIPSVETIEVNYGTELNSILPKQNYVTNDGKIIKGWNINKDGNGHNPEIVTEDITLYAQWQSAYAYKLVGSDIELNFVEEPSWDYSNGQRTTLKQLAGWNNWKDKQFQYIIFPRKDQLSNIGDYFVHQDDSGLSLLNNYNYVITQDEREQIIREQPTFIVFYRSSRRPFGKLNEDDIVQILQVIIN